MNVILLLNTLEIARNDAYMYQMHSYQYCMDKTVDINQPNYKGSTALHRAASNGYDKVVELLLAKVKQVLPRERIGCKAAFLLVSCTEAAKKVDSDIQSFVLFLLLMYCM